MIFLVLLCVLGLVCADSLLVNTKYGSVQGQYSATNKEWLGIPYASPPVGSLRWQSPQPPTSWAIRNATSYGSFCSQPNIESAEDCLTLNVFAPLNSTANSSLPVYIFVHGGSFIYLGSSFFDGEYMTGQDIVMVTVNYRLGSLGFLYHPKLAANSSTGSSGFYGIQDQRFAFQWVKENIAAFGGNPNKVTIGGESAGGMSICLHLVAPKSAPYFQQAVMQSGGCYSYSLETATIVGDAFAKTLNCTQNNPVDCMRAVPINQIIASQPPAWAPATDPTELSDEPISLLYKGKINNVPLLIGTNKNEWSGNGCVSFPEIASLKETEYRAMMARRYYWIDADSLVKAYPFSSYSNALQAVIDADSDFMFKCSTKAIANVFSVNNPTYLFVN